MFYINLGEGIHLGDKIREKTLTSDGVHGHQHMLGGKGTQQGRALTLDGVGEHQHMLRGKGMKQGRALTLDGVGKHQHRFNTC